MLAVEMPSGAVAAYANRLQASSAVQLMDGADQIVTGTPASVCELA